MNETRLKEVIGIRNTVADILAITLVDMVLDGHFRQFEKDPSSDEEGETTKQFQVEGKLNLGAHE